MSLTIIIQPVDGEVLRTRLNPGRNRISVRVGDTYRVIDDATQASPKGMVVRQLDSSLWIDGLSTDADPPVVELADFYTLCSAGSPCQLLVDGVGGAGPIAITPASVPIGALSDGAFVLHDPAWVAPAAPASADSAPMLRYGLYGLGGLAVLGLAAGGGGGGGGDGTQPGGQRPPDGTLKVTSGDYNKRLPVIRGEGEPGAQVTLRIDTDGDGVVNVTYVATVDDQFRWQVDLASATPASGALPANGLGDSTTLGVTVSGSGGSGSLAPMTIRFDDTPPAIATIDRIAGDGIVNGPEKAAGVLVTGSAEAGAEVTVRWGGQSVDATVGVDGRWQARFAAATIPADGASQVEVVVRDSAGNSSPVASQSALIDTRPAALGIGSIAGDGMITLADGAQVAWIGTADPAARVAVNWNGLERVVNAGPDGAWSVSYDGAEIPGLDAMQTPYTVVATNASGNTGTLTGTVLVDRVAPGAPVLDSVTGDDRVTVAERSGGGGIAIVGSASPGSQVDVSWGSTTHRGTAGSDGRWAVNFANSELPAVVSPGSDTLITARATDSAGNVGPVADRTVYIEQPFPPPTIAPVSGDDIVNVSDLGSGVLLSGNVSAGAPGVQISWGSFSGTATLTGATTWQLAVPGASLPANGLVPVVATITGNPSATASRPVTIDTVAPPAPIIQAVTGDNRIDPAERGTPLQVNGTAETGATVNVNWGGGSWSSSAPGGNWSITIPPGQIPTGSAGVSSVMMTATAIDAAGNTGTPANLPIEIVTPFGPPVIATIALDDRVNGTERAAGVLINGTVEAGAAGVQVSWGGFSDVAPVTGTQWSLVVAAGSVPADGLSTVTATVTGDAGGAASARQVTVDTSAPGAPVVAPVTGDDSISTTDNLVGFVIEGNSEAGAAISVTLGTLHQTATANGAGIWSTGPFMIPAMQAGTLTLEVLATDVAGNTGPATVRTITTEDAPSAVHLTPLDDPLALLLAAALPGSLA